MFERLTALGVPFDRTGIHNYKHGIENICDMDSIAMAVGGYGCSIGKSACLGEFNWKRLTRLSPEIRADYMHQIYSNLLRPRAIPDVCQFHFQETLSANPRRTRIGIRHYETINLDRRPKLEGLELMKLIQQYTAPSAPVRELPLLIAESNFKDSVAKATFTIENKTARTQTLQLEPVSFEASCKLLTPSSLTLAPGAKIGGIVEIRLKPDAPKGAYHFFIKASYGTRTAIGWGIAANAGAPSFDANPVMPELVEYTDWDNTRLIDWSLPTCVAFDPACPVLELEMAYQVFNTLQSATGTKLRLCATTDIPAEFNEKGNVILVGNLAAAPFITDAGKKFSPEKGHVIIARHGTRQTRVLLYGTTPVQVAAAATDFTLRYWKNAKDASINITGIEKGSALGHPAAAGVSDTP